MNTTGKLTIRTKEEIQSLVELWKRGGKSKTEFCREQNINYQTFIGWTTPKKTHREKSPAFIPIALNDSQKPFAEIHFKNGSRVCFYRSVGAKYFQSLLK